MNNIPIDQNKPDNITKMQAVRAAYTCGKKLLMRQIILTGPVTIIMAILKITGTGKWNIDITYYAALAGGVISVIDILINKQISIYKTDAANIQEQFDCDIYDMEWNAFNAGSKVPSTKIKKYAKKYVENPSAKLTDWYPLEVQEHSLEKAIFICQKVALSYDRELRNRFKSIFVNFCIGIFILLFLIGLKYDFTVPHFFIQVLIPFLPVLIITWKVVNDHLKSIKASASLQAEIDRQDYPGNILTMQKLRMIQDKIYCSRRDSPLIPDFYYYYHRKSLEEAMHEQAGNAT